MTKTRATSVDWFGVWRFKRRRLTSGGDPKLCSPVSLAPCLHYAMRSTPMRRRSGATRHVGVRGSVDPFESNRPQTNVLTTVANSGRSRQFLSGTTRKVPDMLLILLVLGGAWLLLALLFVVALAGAAAKSVSATKVAEAVPSAVPFMPPVMTPDSPPKSGRFRFRARRFEQPASEIAHARSTLSSGHSELRVAG